MSDDTDAGVEKEGSGAPQDQAQGTDAAPKENGAEGDTDVAALLEEERTQHAKTKEERDNYKTALEQKRQLRKPAPKAGETGEEEDDDELKPVTRRDLQAFAETLQRGNADQAVSSVLSEMVKDPAKRELVRLTYENRIAKTGTSEEAVRADIQAALDLADARIIKRKNAEIARAARQKEDTTPPLNGSGSDRGPAKKDHKWSQEQERTLRAKANDLGVDPEKYLVQTWKNASRT